MSSPDRRLLPTDSLSSSATHYADDEFQSSFVTAGPNCNIVPECEDKVWEQFYYSFLPDSAYGLLLSALLALPTEVYQGRILQGGPAGPGPLAVLDCADGLVLRDSKVAVLLVQVLERLQLPPAGFRASGLVPALKVLCKHELDEVTAKARNLLGERHTAVTTGYAPPLGW